MRRIVRASVVLAAAGVLALLAGAPAGATQVPHWGGKTPAGIEHAPLGWGGSFHRVHPTPPGPTPPPIVAAPVAGGCAPNGVQISGTLSGEDGYYVSAMLGFDIKDVSGNTIGLDGCPFTSGGYGTTLRINHCLTANGSPSDAPTGQAIGDCPTLRQTKTWSIVLPSNAATVWVEAYPMRESSVSWIGYTDKSKYGMSYRRAMQVYQPGTRAMMLPVNCGRGGTTGTLVIRGFHNGAPASMTSANAWSLAPDGDALTPILGMGTGAPSGTGQYTIPSLVPGSYTVIATANGATRQPYNVPVGACATTTYDIQF